MPVCPSCGVAYLDGEEHRCRRANPGATFFVALGGGAAGYIFGGMAWAMIFCLEWGGGTKCFSDVRILTNLLTSPLGLAFGTVSGAFGAIVSVTIKNRYSA